MKIFLVTRGSHGDIYPYLAVASELIQRGHSITLSVPEMFEKEVQAFGLNYVLQGSDDIGGMMEGAAQTSQSFKYILKWIRRVIDKQFEQFIPILKEHDVFVSANTEFAAVSIAEYCKKPIIRTAYAPLIPGKKIPPPIIPLSNTNALFTPAFMWKLLNVGTNFMVLKTVNKNRARLGMEPLKKYGTHAAGKAYNYLMHSEYLGNTDPEWEYKWKIGGYCFNDVFNYDKELYNDLLQFIKNDDRPTIFFTLGSCDAKKKNSFCERLFEVCTELNYKLIVGSGWSKTGSNLSNNQNLYIMDRAIPHNLIFPHCNGIIHHGGSGTTHSVARAGKPQMIIPLIIDQAYWATRLKDLEIGPGKISIDISHDKLRQKVSDMINNPGYSRNATVLAEKMKEENGIKNLCNYIESFLPAVI